MDFFSNNFDSGDLFNDVKVDNFAVLKVYFAVGKNTLNDTLSVITIKGNERGLKLLGYQKSGKKFVDLLLPNNEEVIDQWIVLLKDEKFPCRLKRPDEVPVDLKYIGILDDRKLEE